MSDMTNKTVPVELLADDIRLLRKAISAMRYDVSADAKWGYVHDFKYTCTPERIERLLDAAEAAPPSPVTELEAMLYEALRAFRDGGPEGGTDFNGWHQSYEEPCRLAREALAAYEAKKEGK